MRRRRAVFLLALALACGGLAASEVGGRVAEVESRTGRPVSVVVAARDVKPGARLGPRDLAVRDVPGRFVPPDAARNPPELAGVRVEGGLRRGAYVTASALGAGGRTRGQTPLRKGERAIQVAVAGGDPLSQAGGPGSRVDVLVSTEPRDGAGRTFLALEDVELLGLGGSHGAARLGRDGTGGGHRRRGHRLRDGDAAGDPAPGGLPDRGPELRARGAAAAAAVG